MDIDTHGGLPTPQSREMDMDPGPRKGSLTPGIDPSRKQSVENTPDEKDQTIRGTSNSTNGDDEDELEVPLDFPSLTVNEENIIKAAKEARRLTSGGLQQITPWHLKRALLASSSDTSATAAAHLATRWGKGNFPLLLGELVAESKLIALYKYKRKVDVRLVSIGCSLRRLISKAYCNNVRTRITQIVSPTQLGSLQGGYKIGIHAMRAISPQASTNGELSY